MYFRILLISLLFSCATKPSPKPVVLPLTKKALDINQEETLYTLGYMSDYEIWEFLNERPSEKDVLDTFKSKTEEVIQEMIETDSKSKKIFEAYDKFRISFKDWSTVSDRIYYEL